MKKDGVVYSMAKFLVVVRVSYVDGVLDAVKEYDQYHGNIPAELLPATEIMTAKRERVLSVF